MMDNNEMLAELRTEPDQINEAILTFERFERCGSRGKTHH
jgi:hypothetical protein